MKFSEFAKKVSNTDIVSIQKKVADNNSKFAADLNREQLMKGKDIFDENISPEYRSYSYALEKNAMNNKPEFNTPDLKLTGAFHESIKFEPIFLGSDRVGGEMFATDEKAPLLASKYKNSIGLSEKNQELLINRNTVDLAKIWLKQIGIQNSFTPSIL